VRMPAGRRGRQRRPALRSEGGRSEQPGVGVLEPAGHHREHLVGEARSVLQHGRQRGPGDDEHGRGEIGDDRRCARPPPEDGQLAEVLAGRGGRPCGPCAARTRHLRARRTSRGRRCPRSRSPSRRGSPPRRPPLRWRRAPSSSTPRTAGPGRAAGPSHRGASAAGYALVPSPARSARRRTSRASAACRLLTDAVVTRADPWNVPGYWWSSTDTPACRRRSA
jgi:hypothetical protein